MATTHEPGSDDFQRPYTLGTFQSKLNRFQDLIREITYQDYEATQEERRQWITENLRYDQFCEKIRELFGSDIKNQDLKSVYRKISTNPDAKVDWSESGVEDEEITVGEEVSIFMVSKRRRVGEAAGVKIRATEAFGGSVGDRKRRDSVQHIKHINGLDCYLAASQKGAISVWTSKEPAWVTGCDYLPGLRRVACCTERSIAVWDNRAKGKTQQIFIIKPIEHSPQCMTYVPSPSSHEDMILFGDDQGYVNALTIVAKDLTMKNSKGERRNSQNISIDPSKLSHPIARRKIHGDWVLKVKYFPDLRCFASCSPSSHQSFVLEEPERLYDNGEVRGVSIPKGVNCFDYCARANIIATGGVDKIIRVWHPHIFSRPTGKLMGHLFTIIDIACNERDQHIISLSTARVFRVWDIHTLTCLQVFTDNEERPGEKRIYSMLFDNKHERLLTGSSVIDAWPLTRAVQDTMQVPHTHDRPVVKILSNKELNQVVSVCTESVIKVWELDTGKLVYSITEAHGPNVEVTAIALDKSGYRLVSGAFDGSLKVWDFGAGQVIKSKAGRGTDEDLSITGLVYQRFYDDHVIVASGWTNKIRLMLDASDNNDFTLLREFSDAYYWTREVSLTPTGSPTGAPSLSGTSPLPDIGQPIAQVTSIFRKDYLLTSHEVTCMTPVNSDLVATGCANGNVIFWHIEKSVVDRIFTLPAQEALSAHSRYRQRQAGERRVHDLKVLVHKVRHLDPAYIKKLTGYHRSDTEDADEEEQSLQSRRSKRSVVSVGQGQDGQLADESLRMLPLDDESRRMLRELSMKVEGSNPAPKDGAQTSRTATATARSTGVVDTEGKEKGAATTDVDSGDPDAKMIVDTFDPILVTVHQDAFVRFWDMESGEILREVSPLTRRQGVPVTAVCHDADVNFLVTGDNSKLFNFELSFLGGAGKVEVWEVFRWGWGGGGVGWGWGDGGVGGVWVGLGRWRCSGGVGEMEVWEVFGWGWGGGGVGWLGGAREVEVLGGVGEMEVWEVFGWGCGEGYLTFWDVKAFMEDPGSSDPNVLKQVICWRAHLTRIVALEYIDSQKAILSASTDGSVRVWWGQKGRFVGFFGQHRPFNFPASEETSGTPTLPYDITEGPLAPIKRKSATQKIRSVQKFEYPLIFDKHRWEPFRRSAYMARRNEILKPEDKKFFQALIKPKAYNTHLESFTTGEKKYGAVFRALPVYRVRTPKRPKTPEMSYKLDDDEEENMYGPTSIFGITGAVKHARTRPLRGAHLAHSPTHRSQHPQHVVPRLKAVYVAMQGVKAFQRSINTSRALSYNIFNVVRGGFMQKDAAP
ncbi:hypothetical protein BaRGS_00003798, partial [Batillaria attramentaria]